MPAGHYRVAPQCRLYYQTFGQRGPWIVCINGTAQSTINWIPLARRLADDCRVLLYDCRGQGRSDMGRDRLGLDDHLSDLHALMEHLDIHKAILVGFSHGAYLATAFAQRFPAGVQALALCSLGDRLGPRGEWAKESWRHLVENGGVSALARAILPWVLGQRFIDKHQAAMGIMAHAIVRHNTVDALKAHFETTADYPTISRFTAGLPAVPVLVISGDDDLLVPADRAAALARLCNGRHCLLPETGHSVVIESPQRFYAQLKEFIGEVAAVTSS